LAAITKGQSFGDVLDEFNQMYKNAEKEIAKQISDPDEVFAQCLMGAIYRIYLMGVEDGMKPEPTEREPERM